MQRSPVADEPDGTVLGFIFKTSHSISRSADRKALAQPSVVFTAAYSPTRSIYWTWTGERLMSIRNVLLAMLLVGVASPAVAQHRMSEGNRLRVEVQEPNLGPTATYEGTLVYSPNGFSLHAIDPAADGEVIAVPLSGVTRIEMATARNRGRSARRGATFGAFLGGSLGLIAGPIIASQNLGSAFTPIVAKSTAGGLVAGTALGALGGALFARDGWQRYSVPVEWR
jgi:hypothetical protein